MNGEYYVFCKRCSCKVFNTEAIWTKEQTWQCKKHQEIFEYSSRTKKPTDNIFIPKITRAPGPNKFVGDDITTWEEIETNWEDISTNWENT